MPIYHFKISGPQPFDPDGGFELADDAEAWAEARSLIRDAEESLMPGEDWVLDVRRADVPLFRIKLQSERLA